MSAQAPTTADRLERGAAVMVELAGKVRQLEEELGEAIEDRNEARRDAETSESEACELRGALEDIEDAKPVLEMLEDVRRGVRDIDELYDAFLREGVCG